MSRLGRFVIKHRFPQERREVKVENDNPCAKREVCSLKQCQKGSYPQAVGLPAGGVFVETIPKRTTAAGSGPSATHFPPEGPQPAAVVLFGTVIVNTLPAWHRDCHFELLYPAVLGGICVFITNRPSLDILMPNLSRENIVLNLV
ncbi:hypothetical protein DPMN_084288 [Dreissena polymorpha]|uniref:Uncharacterized protein n=1 Tax=Dreissena polymorpha TaxID=45954 RepID=A0A9D3YE25_DREPO|nr:hypothetical protein DPMN_084288 [Dreissena polymorpha]